MIAVRACTRIINIRNRITTLCKDRATNSFAKCTSSYALILTRGYKSHQWPYARELYHRRLKEGPVPEKHRSKYLNWNYDVELFAFANRISEQLSTSGLLQACSDASHAAAMKQLVDSSVKNESLQALEPPSNDLLSQNGRSFADRYIREFLKIQLPSLPMEGIEKLVEFLLTGEKLCHVGRHLGLDDLILCEAQPVPDDVVSRAFLAVVGLLVEEKGEERAGLFVRDFLITQLIGEDIDDIFPLTNAMEKLESLLRSGGHGDPEPRLIGQLGQETLVSCYYVGIYCNKELIGKAPGETYDIAEEMAARDALMSMYGIQDNRLPLEFS